MRQVGAALLQLGQRVIGVVEPEVDLHARVLVAEPGQGGRHEARADRGEVADASRPVRPARRSASAVSASATFWLMIAACPVRSRPAAVGRTPRPKRSSSTIPASFSSTAICWLTAEGVYPRWAAAAVTDPLVTTARRICIRLTSSM